MKSKIHEYKTKYQSMSKKILLLAGLSILASCSKVSDDEFIITGTATGIENGKMRDPVSQCIFSDRELCAAILYGSGLYIFYRASCMYKKVYC